MTDAAARTARDRVHVLLSKARAELAEYHAAEFRRVGIARASIADAQAALHTLRDALEAAFVAAQDAIDALAALTVKP